MKLRTSKGCSGWWIVRWSRAGPASGGHDGAVDHVEELAERDGRRAGEVAALVPGRVGDDEPVGRRQEGVEEELAVLGAGVVVPDVRVGGDEVVAVALDVAGEDAVVEAEQADHPVGHRPHGDERADGEVAGAEVGPGRAAPEAVGRGGRGRRPGPARPGSPTPAARRLLDQVVEQALQLHALPGVLLGWWP